MKKTVRRIFLILLLLIFIISTGWIAAVRLRYRTSREKYANAAEQFTSQPVGDDGNDSNSRDDTAPDETPDVFSVSSPLEGLPPITVNFDRLREKNGDVIGWIYCEDTAINYPVVHAPDNEYYLDRDYLGEFDPSGAIFTDEVNTPGFLDSNTIIYGHHMADMSMFASLEYWLEEDYFASHPTMWLLTPEQNFRVDLFSVYQTVATSSTYTVFYQPRLEFDNYLRQVQAWSNVTTGVELDSDSHYVVLSTCAYNYDEGRTVLHGKLVPVDAAPISQG